MDSVQVMKSMLPSLAIAALIFLVDLALPLGVAGGVPYVAVVLLGIWFPERRVLFYLAGLGTVLTILGYFLSPSGGIPLVVLTNRALALFAIWTTAFLAANYKKRVSPTEPFRLKATRIHRRVYALVLIMTLVVAISSGGAIAILYDTAFEGKRRDLIQTARSQARLMEAVARFDQQYSRSDISGGAAAATIAQIRDAHEHYSGLGETGEFALARHVGGEIVFLLRHRHQDLDEPKPVPFAGPLAEPMRQALLGHSGSLISRDYRGKMVLAAYEPVAILDLGIVAKVDLDEIRTPFIHAGAIVAVFAFVLIAGGTALFFRVSGFMMRRIAESERNFRLVAENIPNVFWICTPNLDKVIYVSPAYETVWERSCESLYRNPESFLDPIHPGDKEDVFRKLAETEGGKWNLEYRIIRPDGTVCWISDKGFPVHDNAGNTILMAGLAQDITESVTSEKEVFQAKEEAVLANRVKSEFLANMSHELRTPLNAVLGFSDVMQEGVFGDLGNRKYEEYARDIHESGRHLLELINDILDLSKIEAEALLLDEEFVRLGNVAEAASRLIRPRAENGRVIVLNKVDDIPLLVLCDERRLKQILVNLLSNAVKFSDAGDTVVLDACVDDDGGVSITVSDMGIGMDEEELNIALTPFGQVDGSLARKHEGTGLGLPLTEALVKLHGGTMVFESRKTEGTKVTIRFPAERVSREAA